MTLDQLAVGQSAVIGEVNGPPELVQRLLEMGLIDGEPIEVLGVAPLGDPVRLRLASYQLSLRRDEAAHVTVREVKSVGVAR